MKDIKIVEYNPSLAKGIAEMWNNSGEGWNGDRGYETEQMILDKEEKSSHLNLYIAMDGEKVVGYCKLSCYAYDENTLYVDLLNVLPSYHGHKIGKMLILKSVERTIELGYPRLDLFTWAGNTKAVPLYKKTGFFWERMETNSTHLMNFIPTVLTTELLEKYINDFDWYNDSDRIIEVCPDGEKKNNFDLYTYSWKKNDKRLAVTFEKTGRGIQAVNTDDFFLECVIPEAKLVFGKAYPVSFNIVNKTDKPLSLKIKGVSDKNISYEYSYESEITDEVCIASEFFLRQVDHVETMWATHPSVKAEIEVNGKKALFKSGIKTQYPLSVNQYYPNGPILNQMNNKMSLFLNIKNGFNQNCDFTLRLPEMNNLIFQEKEIFLALTAEEKTCLSTEIIITGAVAEQIDLDIEVNFENNRFCYQQKLDILLMTATGRAGYESKNKYYLISGKNLMNVDKESDCNEMFFNNTLSEVWAYINPPKIGKPFTSEFKNRPPYQSEFKQDAESISLTLYHQSEDYPGCRFACHYKLLSQGFLEYSMELLNFPDNRNEIDLCHSINFDQQRLQMAYDGEIIKTDDCRFNDSEIIYWDSKKLDENWFFNEKGHSTVSVIWDKKVRPVFCQWEHVFEYHFDETSSRTTPPLIIALDFFHSVEQVRNFALGHLADPKGISQSMELLVNKGNPFVKKDLRAIWKDKKVKVLEGEFTIMYHEQVSKTPVEMKDERHEVSALFDLAEGDMIEFVEAQANYSNKTYHQKKAVFKISDRKIEKEKLHLDGYDVCQVRNGLLEFSASAEFGPSVFSLKYQGREWLDSNFPVKGPKSWWNPWIGGICKSPSGFRMLYYLEENSKVELTQKTDQYGNIWEGILMTTHFEKYEPLKGITISQYFLTMSDLPLLMCFYEMENQSGHHKKLNPYTHVFMKPDEDLKKCEFGFEYEGEFLKTTCGIEDINFETPASLLCYMGANRKEKLYLFNGDHKSKMRGETDLLVVAGVIIQALDLRHNVKKTLAPEFFIFSEKVLKEKNLMDLKNIRF